MMVRIQNAAKQALAVVAAGAVLVGSVPNAALAEVEL